MKKDKRSQVKSAKKEIREQIKQSLVKELKSLAGKLGHGSKKLDKKIAKGAEQLAKKLTKEIKIDKLAVAESTAATEVKVADISKASVKPAKRAAKVAEVPVPSAS